MSPGGFTDSTVQRPSAPLTCCAPQDESLPVPKLRLPPLQCAMSGLPPQADRRGLEMPVRARPEGNSLPSWEQQFSPRGIIGAARWCPHVAAWMLPAVQSPRLGPQGLSACLLTLCGLSADRGPSSSPPPLPRLLVPALASPTSSLLPASCLPSLSPPS